MARPRQFEEPKVLERAASAFWMRGYEGVTIQDLCGATGLGPGSLYGAFGDKRALFVAALDHYTRLGQQNFARILSEQRGADGVRAYFVSVVDRLASANGHRGCFVTNAAIELGAHDAEIAKTVELHWARLEAMFREILAEARALDQLRTGAGPDCALMLVCLVQGLNVTARTRPSKTRLEGMVESVISQLLVH